MIEFRHLFDQFLYKIIIDLMIDMSNLDTIEN